MARFNVYYVIYSECQDSVSWIFRGQAQQNNTVLTFNMGDTLNLMCLGFYNSWGYNFFMIISKGDSPPSEISVDYPNEDVYELTISGDGTVIYDDFYGIYAGYENFVVVPGPFQAAYASGRDYRNVGVALLQPADAGTYHCTGRLSYIYNNYIFYDYGVIYSGGLTIMVNTKEGQAKSATTNANKLLTYTALIMGASKFLF